METKRDNPNFRPLAHGDELLSESIKAEFEKIGKKYTKKFHEFDENQKPVHFNGLLDAIRNSIEWEIKDGQLILKSGLRYNKKNKQHGSKRIL